MILGWIPFVSWLNPRKVGKTQKSWGVNQIPPTKMVVHVHGVCSMFPLNPSAKTVSHRPPAMVFRRTNWPRPKRGSLPLQPSGFSSPPRPYQKWMVDGFWLELKNHHIFFTLIYQPFSGKSLGSSYFWPVPGVPQPFGFKIKTDAIAGCSSSPNVVL